MIVNIDEYREYLCYSGFRQNIEQSLPTWEGRIAEFSQPPYFRNLKKAFQSLFLESFCRTTALTPTPQINIDLASLLKDIIGFACQTSLSDPDYRESLHSVCLLLQYYFKEYHFTAFNMDAILTISRETIYHLLQIECLSLTVLNYFASSPHHGMIQEVADALFYEVGGVESGAAYLLTHSFFRKISEKIHESEASRAPFYKALENRMIPDKWKRESITILSFLDSMEKGRQQTQRISYNSRLYENSANSAYPTYPYPTPENAPPVPEYAPSVYAPPSDEFSGNQPYYAPQGDPTWNPDYPQDSQPPSSSTFQNVGAPSNELKPAPTQETSKPYGSGTELSVALPESLKELKNNPELVAAPKPTILKETEKKKKRYGEKQGFDLLEQQIAQVQGQPHFNASFILNLLKQYQMGTEILPNLIPFLADSKTKKVFEEVLLGLCGKHPEYLFDFLKIADFSVLLSICTILQRMGPHSAVFQKLTPLLSHPNPEVRSKVAETLNGLFPRETTDLLITKLSDSQEDLRKLALEYLPKDENKQIYFKILSLVESPDFEKKDFTEKRGLLISLAIAGQKAAIPKLKEFVEQTIVTKILRKDSMNRQLELKKCALRALSYIRDDAVVVLLKQIEQWKNAELSLLAKLSLAEREKNMATDPKASKKD